VILTGRNPERLQRAARDLDALSTAAFDAMDPIPLERFFRDLPTIEHVMVTAGRPYYGRFVDMDFAQVRRLLDEHLFLALYVARNATNKVRPGGTLLFMGGIGGRRPAIGLSVASAVSNALPALTASLALEIVPVRVNLIAAGFVNSPASLLGDQLDKRRNQLRATLSIRRAVGPPNVRCARRTHHDQHGPHGLNLRRRRRAAARRRLATKPASVFNKSDLRFT
jgi:NAD(P)-dependent dehydrogenase (short-subunit alcohol dehydrogenase family)